MRENVEINAGAIKAVGALILVETVSGFDVLDNFFGRSIGCFKHTVAAGHKVYSVSGGEVVVKLQVSQKQTCI